MNKSPLRRAASLIVQGAPILRGPLLRWTDALHRAVGVWDSPPEGGGGGKWSIDHLWRGCLQRGLRRNSNAANGAPVPHSLWGAAHFRNPYPAYAALRAHSPVYFDPVMGCWMALGYKDVSWALRQPNLFSNQFTRQFDPFLAGSDPPEHTRYRQALMPHFSCFEAASITDFCRKWLTDFVTRARRAGRIEVVRDLSVPLPQAFTTHLLGFTESERAAIDAVLSPQRSDMNSALEAVGNIVAGILEAIRKEPRPGLAGSLLTAPAETRCSDVEILSTVRHLWFAGTVTASTLIPSALCLLFRHDDVRRQLSRDLSLMPAFVSEALRLESPTQNIPRRATQAFEFGGRLIPEGAMVKLCLAAANRDPARFENPDRLLLERPTNAHLAFGLGAHFCMGAAIARTLVGTALEVLLTEFPRMRPLEPLADLSYEDSDMFRAMRRLHITLQ